MSYCSENIGRKLRMLSLLATCSVVVIHSNFLERLRDVPWAWWFGNVVAYLQMWAVPYFFMVSGFFFERAFQNKAIVHHWKIFLGKKVKAVLIPYLLWGICYGIIAMTLLRIGVAILHGDGDIWEKTVFHHWGSWKFLDDLLGITHAPLIGALWYLRVLLILFFTAPIWIALFRYAKWIGGLVGVFLILYSPLSGMFEEQFVLFNDVVFRIKLNALGWVFKGITLPRFVFFFHQLHPIFTLLALWGIGEHLSNKLPQQLPSIFTLGFWIYCIHHPLTGYVAALGHAILGRSIYAQFVLQLVAWGIVLMISIFLARACEKLFPRVYSILCGGR